MARERLVTAANALETAAEEATEGDVEAGVAEHAETIRDLAERDEAPDHGRLARHIHTLDELADDANRLTADHVRDAIEELQAYRETVDGV